MEHKPIVYPFHRLVELVGEAQQEKGVQGIH
jgi:hypothetical protein